jgi:GTP-binding protein
MSERDGRRGGEETPEGAEDLRVTRIALVGKPNTGKSSLANCILGSERMIVSDIPAPPGFRGFRIVREGRELVLIDTAGLRKKGKISEKVEEYSVSMCGEEHRAR